MAHGLRVGDYVQLLNTTTTPNIDGIHKVTKIGTNEKVFYIDEYIEKCGNAVAVQPVTTRFADYSQKQLAVASTQWNLPTGTIVFANNKDQVRGTYVYKVLQYNTVVATQTVADTVYRIVSQGTTDFTTIGAPNNDIGTVFIATGVGTGDGTVQQAVCTYVRNTTKRPTNKDIDSVLIYSHTNNQLKYNLKCGIYEKDINW